MNCKTHELSVTYVSYPSIVATSIVAVLQAPDDQAVDKAPCVQVYNTCIPYEPAMSKYKAHEYTTSVHQCIYKNKRALFLCQLSVAKYIQSCIYHFGIWLYMAYFCLVPSNFYVPTYSLL